MNPENVHTGGFIFISLLNRFNKKHFSSDTDYKNKLRSQGEMPMY